VCDSFIGSVILAAEIDCYQEPASHKTTESFGHKGDHQNCDKGNKANNDNKSPADEVSKDERTHIKRKEPESSPSVSPLTTSSWVPGLADYVELKTYKEIRTDKDQWSWRRYRFLPLVCELIDHIDCNRYKLLAFWIQSYIVGVSHIVCGFRDQNGIVKQPPQMLTTTAIPRMAEGAWVN
jgi:hypothetical protein